MITQTLTQSGTAHDTSTGLPNLLELDALLMNFDVETSTLMNLDEL